ncbi:hypothetical protein E3T24_15185 [Cryobacterium sp. TmT2-59]|uniref:hypothetical protein n=1 Tax=Cryobacterium sp. TmT2-59 TaxID=1259264 RepID=UPI00106BFEFB|nr:hypothetical protein [Cryobacterium sp. TmT2-59]TFC81497.1 hypothetical protein E3T24_15185 [Cryobacterium sp. TmT2-59]
MIANLGLNRLLWVVTGGTAIAAAVAGILNPSLYTGLVAETLLPGALSQDIISVLAGIGLLVLAALARPNRRRQQLLALGLLGYLFYAYGIYVIERAYNGFYLVYLAIFTLAFWSVVYGTASLRREVMTRATMPRGLRVVSAVGALLQPLMFYPLWIAMLIPLMRDRDQIDSLYSIFILDLGFIMPAFLILAVLVFRNRGAGLVLLPSLYVLGFTLIFSLALAELVKPVFGTAPDLPALAAAALLSAVFLVLGGLHLRRLDLSQLRADAEEVRPLDGFRRPR